MDITEAYRVMQKHCRIEVGDKVRVLRTVEGSEMGFGQSSRLPERDGAVGECFRVMNIASDNQGIELNCPGYMHFPFFCLELVEKAKPELPPIMVGSHEVEFIDNEGIRVCSEYVAIGTLRKMLDRLEHWDC